MSVPVTMAADLPVLPVGSAATAPDPATASAFAEVLGGALDGSSPAAPPTGGNPPAGTAQTAGLWSPVPGPVAPAPDDAVTAETTEASEADETAGAPVGESRPGRTRPDDAEKPTGDAAATADASATVLPLAGPVAGLLPVAQLTGSAASGAAATSDTGADALDAIGGPSGQPPVSPGARLDHSAPALASGQPTAPAAFAAEGAGSLAAEASDEHGTVAADAATTPANAAATRPHAASTLTDGRPTWSDAGSTLTDGVASRPDAAATAIGDSVPGARPQPATHAVADEMTGTPALAAATSSPAPLPTPAVTAATEPTGAERLAAAQPELGASLARLRHKGDGTSELSLSLHPAELGSVGVTATVRGGQLTVTVACADPAAHEAVTAALPALRHDLAAAGFTAIDVTVGDSGRQQDQHDTPPGSKHTAEPDHQPADAPLRRPLTPVRNSTDRGIDRWL